MINAEQGYLPRSRILWSKDHQSCKNLTLRNRLNTQQEQEHKENAINGPLLLGRNRERYGDFSSVTQRLQHRQEQKLPLCFIQHKISSFHSVAGIQTVLEHQPLAVHRVSGTKYLMQQILQLHLPT